MDAQVEYVVAELRGRPGLNQRLAVASITVDEASDDVAYEYEAPAAMLDAKFHKRPRTDPSVQKLFRERRPHAQAALRAYRAAQAAR